MSNAEAAFAIPGDIETRTGGYIYDRRVLEELRAAGHAIAHCQLPGSYPNPDAAGVAASLDALNACEGSVLVDGLAWGALPHDAARRVAPPVIALCHHPLGLEAGLSEEQAKWFTDNETQNLALARRVVVTSAATAATLTQDFAVPGEKIAVAEPGIDPALRATGSGGADVELLCVGALIPRKGYDVLIDALAQLTDLPWRLRVAGSHARAPNTAADITRRIAEAGLGGRIQLVGELERKELDVVYARSDVFVLSSHYEGYGMVLAEAMACGLPVVTTTGGAAASTVPGGAALKVPPGDSAALADALRRAMIDSDLREQLAEASWKAGQELPRWSETAAIVAAAIEDVRRQAQ
ncbi:MAG: glycosyltransferase family 4 protein [Beijerinckiaceae bacterium]